jgi:hypothetical protein
VAGLLTDERVQRAERGVGLLQLRQVPCLADDRELRLREGRSQGLPVPRRDDPVAVTPEHQARDVYPPEPTGQVRAMISGTITRPGLAPVRPGIRFGLIDYALAPFRDSADLAQLKRDLAVTVSAEALFTLTDLCGLGPDEAISSAAQTAATLTAAAFSGVRETRPVRD